MRRPVLFLMAITLVAASCTGGDAETTTSTEASTTSTTATTVPETTTTSSTTTTTTPSSPVIAREGDENEIVATLQLLLECRGYGDLTLDGKFGPATTTAVQAAQGALGQEPTGVATEDLFGALSRGCTAPRPIEVGDEAVTVIGYAAPDAPQVFPISLLFGSTLRITAVADRAVIIEVKNADGSPVDSDDGSTFLIPESADYTIEVTTTAAATMVTLEVEVDPGAGAGDWIITTDGIAYKDTEFPLGTAAGPMIDEIFEVLDHNVRAEYDEFDTGWDDPDQLGYRGIFIEGLAFLFTGPTPGEPDLPETFARVRYVGPSFDKDGNPRPAGWVQTLSGITVGNTLAELKDTYGSGVAPGSDTVGHYYRYGTSTGHEVCFYFGNTAPTDGSRITEISTMCRG